MDRYRRYDEEDDYYRRRERRSPHSSSYSRRADNGEGRHRSRDRHGSPYCYDLDIRRRERRSPHLSSSFRHTDNGEGLHRSRDRHGSPYCYDLDYSRRERRSPHSSSSSRRTDNGEGLHRSMHRQAGSDREEVLYSRGMERASHHTTRRTMERQVERHRSMARHGVDDSEHGRPSERGAAGTSQSSRRPTHYQSMEPHGVDDREHGRSVRGSSQTSTRPTQHQSMEPHGVDDREHGRSVRGSSQTSTRPTQHQSMEPHGVDDREHGRSVRGSSQTSTRPTQHQSMEPHGVDDREHGRSVRGSSQTSTRPSGGNTPSPQSFGAACAAKPPADRYFTASTAIPSSLKLLSPKDSNWREKTVAFGSCDELRPFNNDTKKDFKDFKAEVLETRLRKRTTEVNENTNKVVIISDDDVDNPVSEDIASEKEDDDFKAPCSSKRRTAVAAGARGKGNGKKGRGKGTSNKQKSKPELKKELEDARLKLNVLQAGRCNDVKLDKISSHPARSSLLQSKSLMTPGHSKPLNVEVLKHNLAESGIEDRFIELIFTSCILPKLDFKWDDVGGLDGVKDSIKEMVIYPLLRPDIFKGLRAAPKGVLLYGPPGTGKTMIAQCIASECQSTFFCVSAASLTSKWVGDGEKTMKALFAVARQMQPAVIFIDEADSLLSKRGDKENESSKKMKTEFLIQMDGAATSKEENLLVIAATNRPQDLDEAVRRRFVKRFYIPLPDVEGRRQIAERLMKDENVDITKCDYEIFACNSHGYSGADLHKVCKEAAMLPIRQAGNILELKLEEVRPITFDDLSEALNKVKPSVSPKDLLQYNEFDRLFGDKP